MDGTGTPPPGGAAASGMAQHRVLLGLLVGLVVAGVVVLGCSGTGRPDAAALSASVSASITNALKAAQTPPSDSTNAQPLLGAPQAKVDTVNCTDPTGGTSDCTAVLTVTPLNPTAKPFPQKQQLKISVGTNGCWKADETVDIPGPYGGPETLSGCVED